MYKVKFMGCSKKGNTRKKMDKIRKTSKQKRKR